MKDLLVRTNRGEISASFHLSPFISDWEACRKAFISCIASDFHDLLSPRPDDFSTSVASDPAEAWCKYRIFGGTRTFVLRTDSIRLSFPNMIDDDVPIAAELLRRVLEVLLPKLGGYDRHSYTLSLNYHVDVVEGASHAYLAQFANDEFADALRDEPTIEYRPSVGFTLGSVDGHRVLRRSIEQSEVLPNGLFVATRIFVSIPDLTTVEEEMGWIGRISDLAHRAAGIAYQKDRVDDDSGN